MDKLRKAGLYMSSLFAVKGKMIERYNQCLTALGLEPTALKEIYIDAIGWSPEVADEKQSIYYLNHGGANPYGIIISPQQYGMPVYFPYHSFDRQLLEAFYVKNEEAIKDITTDSAIVINLDQNIDAFYEPSDLIDYDNITVGYKILNELDREQIRQNVLIQKMYQRHNSLDMNLHNKILATANKFGDLRGRSLQLREVDYPTTSFYTKAFGGVFVLRSPTNGHLLIFESMDEINKYTHTYMAEHISSPNLLTELTNRGFISFDIDKLNSARLDRVTQYFFAKSVDDAQHPLSEILANRSLYLKYLNDLSEDEKKKIIGPFKYFEKIAKGHKPDRSNYIADEVYAALHSPVTSNMEELIWQLLCRMHPVDPYLTYYHDKELFYKQYQTYNESYQDWVIQIIQKENNELKK